MTEQLWLDFEGLYAGQAEQIRERVTRVAPEVQVRLDGAVEARHLSTDLVSTVLGSVTAFTSVVALGIQLLDRVRSGERSRESALEALAVEVALHIPEGEKYVSFVRRASVENGDLEAFALRIRGAESMYEIRVESEGHDHLVSGRICDYGGLNDARFDLPDDPPRREH